MEKTFEITKRYTLTILHDQIIPSIPAKFTQGIHRDVNCAFLAYDLIANMPYGNGRIDGALCIYFVLLNEKEDCIGIYRQKSDLGIKIEYQLLLPIAVCANAKKILFITGSEDGWADGKYWQRIPSEARNALKLIGCDFLEFRYIGPNGEVHIATGD